MTTDTTAYWIPSDDSTTVRIASSGPVTNIAVGDTTLFTAEALSEREGWGVRLTSVESADGETSLEFQDQRGQNTYTSIAVSILADQPDGTTDLSPG